MHALVLLSGGLDSTVCLHQALQRDYESVRTLAIDYGQRHMVELNVAGRIASEAGVQHKRLFASATGFGIDSSLRSGADFDPTQPPVLPARNMVLLSIAAAHAAHHNCDDIILGACRDDADNFPDCRPAFFEAARTTLRLALGRPNLRVITPLIDLDKPAIGALATSLGPNALYAAELSWSCYNPQPGFLGVRQPCGVCLACAARARSGVRTAPFAWT